MNIIQLITRMDEPGGAQVHVRDLTLQLHKLGHKVTLLAGSASPVYNEFQEANIPYVYIKNLARNIHPLKDILAFIELRKEFNRFKPDLIAIHSSKAGLIGRLAGWSVGIPTVFTAHGWAFTEGVSRKERWVYRILERVAGKVSSGIITVSKYDFNLAEQNKIGRKGSIISIQNGVLDTGAVSREREDEGRCRLVKVARFAAPKDHLTLIRVLNRIRDHNWEMQFVGDGPLRKQAEDYVRELGLTEKILFLGNRSNVQEILGESDVFILISNWEGLPLSILEAMRSGLPIIASKVGGVVETVEQAQNGFLISKGDEEELTRRLLELITKSDLRKNMGAISRQNYLKCFTFEKMFSETMLFYERVFDESRIKALAGNTVAREE